MSGELRLSDIDRGLRAGMAAVEALRTWVRGSAAYQICDDREQAIKDAERALATLERDWPKAKALLTQAGREYDRYVTQDREPESCSCHLSAPCSFCESQVDEEAAA